MKSTKMLAALTLTSMALALAGCGGGGGSTPGATAGAGVAVQAPAPTSPGPASIPPNPPLNLPAYPAGSAESDAFYAINTFRSSLGLLPLAQSTKLDLAAKNHLAYLESTASYDGGTVNEAAINPATGRSNATSETSGTPGFTGATALDRAVNAMYQASTAGAGVVEELVSYGIAGSTTAKIDAFRATVVHRSELAEQYPRDIGLALGTDTGQTVLIEYGAADGQAAPLDPSYLGVFPTPGSTGVGLTATYEAPNAYPELTAAQYAATAAYPITLTVRFGYTLSVGSFTVTEAGQSAPLAARIVTKADLGAFVDSSVAALVASAPFKPATTYSVAFTGTANGAPVSKTWSFTTK